MGKLFLIPFLPWVPKDLDKLAGSADAFNELLQPNVYRLTSS